MKEILRLFWSKPRKLAIPRTTSEIKAAIGGLSAMHAMRHDGLVFSTMRDLTKPDCIVKLTLKGRDALCEAFDIRHEDCAMPAPKPLHVSNKPHREYNVRGEIFHTQKEIAQRFDLSEHTVANAVQRGRLQFLGLGRGFRSWDMAKRRPRGNEREICGMKFLSDSQLAEFVGLDRSYVCRMMRDGRAERVIELVKRRQEYIDRVICAA